MKKLLFTGLIITALFALASCDPYVCGTDFIENHSSAAIYLYDRDSVTLDTLAPGATKRFDPSCGIGRGDSPEQGPRSCAFITNGSDTCKKNIQSLSEWKTVSIEKHEYAYHFTVTDTDF